MKPFNILTCDLPETVTLFSKEYPVFTSFKNWIKIYEVLNDETLSDEKKTAKALSLCYKSELPPNVISAFLGMLTFLNRGAEFSAPQEKSEAPLFSFSGDADIIYASFLEKYGIDLLKEDMHWFKFCSLFSSLSQDNPFSAVMNIRTFDESKIKDPAKRRKIQKLKRKFGVEVKGKRREVDVAESLSFIF